MATCTPVGTDTTTQGNWSGVYGSDGYNVAEDTSSNPSYVAPSITGTLFNFSLTGDARCLQKASNPSVRINGVWYGSTVVFDLNITSGTHRIGIYMFDGDNSGRAQSVVVIDAGTSATLDSRSVAAFYTAPLYMFWDCSGHVKIQITVTAASNCVASAIFFQPTTTTGAITPFPSPAAPKIIAPIVNAGAGARHQLVKAPASVSLTPTALSPAPVAQVIQGGTINVPYSETITTSGGTAPYTYSVVSGTLPTGTSLNSSSGVISGTPTIIGTYTFTVKSVDANSYSGQQAFSVTISAPQVSNYGYVA